MIGDRLLVIDIHALLAFGDGGIGGVEGGLAMAVEIASGVGQRIAGFVQRMHGARNFRMAVIIQGSDGRLAGVGEIVDRQSAGKTQTQNTCQRESSYSNHIASKKRLFLPSLLLSMTKRHISRIIAALINLRER
jgi:hypothetical protein